MINEIYEFLVEFGFTSEDIKRIEEENDNVFFVSLNKVKENIDFLNKKI